MLIQCTKKLLDRLKMKPEPRQEEEPFFSWHANLVTINRRQTIVLMNDETRYVIVLYGMKAKELSKIKSWIIQAIREVLLDEGVKEELVERYLQEAGEVTFTKTKDRTQVARLNKASQNTKVFSYDQILRDGINQALSMEVSRLLVTDGSGDYLHPNEEMYQAMRQFAGGDIFGTKAAELKVTLMLEGHEVWRKLIVPLNRTFPQLHQILQVAFSWMDYHLHEFYILDNKAPGRETNWNHPAFTEEGFQPVINLVSGNEAFNYPGEEEMRLEYGIKLSEFIPLYNTLVYHYDFGDGWRHKVEVERLIDEYENNHPVCIDGAGDAPPEDVGGEGGYEAFLTVMANPDDPDHESMKQWVASQGYEQFDREEINRRLKNS